MRYVVPSACFLAAQGLLLIICRSKTTWGSRAGADTSDSERMRRIKISESTSTLFCEKTNSAFFNEKPYPTLSFVNDSKSRT